MDKKYILIGIALLGIITWQIIFIVMPTKIALVNFRDSQMAELVNANDNWFIQPKQVDLKEDDFSDYVNFPAIYLFHISALTEAQKTNLKKAMENGNKVHVLMSTSKDNDFSNVAGEDLDYLKSCFENVGAENIRRWLNYSRTVFDEASLFVDEITEPKKFPKDVFYRIGSHNYFEELSEYWNYYKEADLYKKNAKTICIINSVAGPQDQFRSYQDDMILNLESRGFNVVALSGYSKRFENLQILSPDMVIYYPHGRLNISGGNKTVEWLKERNILLLQPQLVHNTYEDWMEDQQGMSGGIFGQNVVVPELDGAIHAYAVAAEYLNDQGFHTFKSIPGRVERFCETAERWLSLKDKHNSEKKLTIFYYKGAGKNALVAGGLEVGTSIYSLLNELKNQGYDLGNLPINYEDFIARLYKDGPLLGDYAKGSLEDFIKEGDPALITVEEYEKWISTALDPQSYENVKKMHGEAPGTYMSININDTSYFVIPKVEFGNIVLVPVLASALGETEFNMVHGVKKAPPHAYIASYLWPRMKLKTDVIAHFGAHGSVEFTPWKQVLLSLRDWPEALIAPVPHLYIYSIDNIGEAMMAKRRTYASMVSHMTPPFTESGLYGPLEEFRALLEEYTAAEDPLFKEKYKYQIQAFADTLSVAKDLGITKEDIKELSDETVLVLEHYMYHLEREKITTGLHEFGIQFEDKELLETARMMSIDPLATSLMELDEMEKGVVDSSMKKNNGMMERYIAEAHKMIDKVLYKSYNTASVMGDSRYSRLKELENKYGVVESEVISAYYGGAYARKKAKKKKAKEKMVYDRSTHKMVKQSELKKAALNTNRAKEIAVHLSASRLSRKGMEWIKTDKTFKEISSLLNSATLHKFKMSSDWDEKVNNMVSLIENESYKELLTFIQDSIERKNLIEYLSSQTARKKIEGQSLKIDAYLFDKAIDMEKMNGFLFVYRFKDSIKGLLKNKSIIELEQLAKQVQFYQDYQEFIIEIEHENANINAIQAVLTSKEALKKLNANLLAVKNLIAELTQKEKHLFKTLQRYYDALNSVSTFRNNLIEAPKQELAAFVNGMNGGYIAPGSGGDMVSNPYAVPTGKNLYSINAEITPTKAAFEIAKDLAGQVIHQHIKKHGEFPKKVAYTLWGGEFIRNQGMNIGQILYMLGVEPVRNHVGRVYDVKLIPMSELKRPRIDVVVQTSGQFRDIAASRIYLINKAIALASNASDNDEYPNFVKEGTELAESQLKEKGLSAKEAKKFSTVRVFGGVNGNYGTAIMELVEQGDRWETEEQIANQYIQNMGAMYAEGSWSQYREGMFETMLQNTEVVVHPRTSNVTGPISLDHVYEFMGGITASIRVTTGKDPDGYFNDARNRYNPYVQELKEAIWTETRTNLFNPKFIKEMMKEGETAAENFAESFRDTYGWNVMKPEAIDKEIWEGYYDIYVKDKDNIGTLEFFKDVNPYALQEMTAVMLETVRKGYWTPSDQVIQDIVDLHAKLVKDHEAGCSGFVCDNTKLKEMIENKLSSEMKESYNDQIDKVRTAGENAEEKGMVLEKEELTLDTMKELIEENKGALVSILMTILIISGFLVFGIYKRRNE